MRGIHVAILVILLCVPFHSSITSLEENVTDQSSHSCSGPNDDCDHDFVTNSAEDVDQDGDWTNDDSDGDGIADYLDDDDDNDGWPTWLECPQGRSATEDNCPGFGPAKDYLSNRLFNCDLPQVQLSYSSPKKVEFYVYIFHNESLVKLGELPDNNTAAIGRSMIDGKMYWINGQDFNIYSWNPENASLVQPSGYASGYTRADFMANGSLLVQRTSNPIDSPLFIFNQTFERTKVAELSSGGGGDLVSLLTGGYLLAASNGTLFTIDSSFENLTVVGDMSDLDNYSGTGPKGGALLQNGSFMFNSGKNLYLLEGDWKDGFDSDGNGANGGEAILKHTFTDPDKSTGGDMATCVISSDDSDGDGLPDHYENYLFFTDPYNVDTDFDDLDDYQEVMSLPTDPLDNDSDDDGLSDGSEVNTHLTNPLDPDSDDDWCSDGNEVLNMLTNPLDIDSDDDGLGDCSELGFSTDPLDADSDDDGLLDGEEVSTYSTDPLDEDDDEDGLIDGLEVNTYNTNPLDNDSDDDGCSDWREVIEEGTNPLVQDSNGDGVLDCIIPTLVSYEPWIWVLYLDEKISNSTPMISGEQPTQWQISPSLPEGLTLQSGIINGSSDQRWEMQNHTITWSGPGGSGSENVVLVIMEKAPQISYPQESYTLKVGEPFYLNVSNVGGSATQWSLNDSLPQGLVFEDGNIQGTPLWSSQPIELEVRAYGPDEFDSTILTLEVESIEIVIEEEKPPGNELFPGLLLDMLVPCLIIFAALLLLSILLVQEDEEVELEEE